MPPDVTALDALLWRDWEQETWRSYQAEVLRLIATGMGAKKLPKFEELLGEANTEPAMTQEQVMEQRHKLLEKLNAG